MKAGSEKPQADVSKFKFLRIFFIEIRNERPYLGSRRKPSCAKVSINSFCRPCHRLRFVDGTMDEKSQTTLQRRSNDGDGEIERKLCG